MRIPFIELVVFLLAFLTSVSAKAATYIPGNLTVEENGILLSTGLTSKLLAKRNHRVKLASGKKSWVFFHRNPDGAAIIEGKNGEYAYVSNSETLINGGAGALYFNAQHEVIGYKRLLRGTVRNCGGGKTWWGTWLSCEEARLGQIWEVDPWNTKGRPKKTLMGKIRKGLFGRFFTGASFEAVAYDRRDLDNPAFYITVDDSDGPVVRFRPDSGVVKETNENGDFSKLLHTGNPTKDFLLLNDETKTFTWTSNLDAAKKSAEQFFSGAEGIDIQDGILYFTAKTPKLLFILDLDLQNYTSSSTVSGAFDSQPDQLARIVGSENDLLYFCEDGALKPSGVHARDSSGQYFTILHGVKGFKGRGEVSGLTFSPDNTRMYVAFYRQGEVFEIRRTDGLPFGGQQLDIQYHESQLSSIYLRQ